jgi:N-acetylglucosaminyl-diphospho-decaprenol L-rhamnosyltransferase
MVIIGKPFLKQGQQYRENSYGAADFINFTAWLEQIEGSDQRLRAWPKQSLTADGRLKTEMVSIVIVNWNSGPYLERCIRSLYKNADEAEIVIVDNASKDSSLSFAVQIGPRITLLQNDNNIGYAAGNNQGWRACKGTSILFLNPDTECFPGSVPCLEQTLSAGPDVWAVGGRLVDPAGQPQTQLNVRAFPTIASVAAEMLLLDEIWPTHPWTRLINVFASEPGGAWDVDQPAAACLMVSRVALESIGGFDEEFRPAWFEDVDLCRRIRNHGGRIRFQPRACFLHHGGSSLENLPRESFLEYFHRNQIRYFLKHHGPKAAARVRSLILLGLYVRTGLSLAYPMVRHTSRTKSAGIFWRAARRIAAFRGAEA